MLKSWCRRDRDSRQRHGALLEAVETLTQQERDAASC